MLLCAVCILDVAELAFTIPDTKKDMIDDVGRTRELWMVNQNTETGFRHCLPTRYQASMSPAHPS